MKNSKNKILAAAVCGIIAGSVGTSFVGKFQASEQNSNTVSSNSTNSDKNSNSNKVITDSEVANGGEFTQNGTSSGKIHPSDDYSSDGSSGRPSGGRGGHHQGEASLDGVETVDVANGKYIDGSYTGSASGYASGLKVQVTISNGAISDIQVVSHNETPGFCERAIETVPTEIISKQSTDVDTISGATYTSVGIINAVNSALSNAQS